MNRKHRILSYLMILQVILPALVSVLPLSATAAQVPWKTAAYTHFSQDEALTSLLNDFCTHQNLKLILDADISGRVSGHFKNRPPKDFFEHITATYNLFWYYDGTVMYIYPASKLTTRIINLEYLSCQRLVDILKDLGIADHRFPIRFVSREKILYLTGPERFVELAAFTAEKLDSKAKARAVTPPSKVVIRVFPLRYAWAGDLEFDSMDGKVTVPGMATILNSLLTGKSVPASLQSGKKIQKTVEKLKGTGLAAQNNGNKPDEAGPAVEQMEPYDVIVQADMRNNSVIVRDLEDRMPAYENIIRTLDIPVGLVEIKVAIIDISKDLEKSIGVDWRLNLTRDQNNVKTRSGYNADPELTYDGTTLADATGLSMTTIIGNAEEYFLARIKALQEDDNARILSEPSVVTLNNIEASIEHNSTIHVRLEGTDEVDLFEVDAGVVLRVTPHIIEEEGRKLMKLVVKIRDGSFQDATIDDIPEVLSSTINTQAVVAEGESLLIGGYTKERKRTYESKVPLLGDIPLLGLLFKSKTQGSEQMERMFLITPKIINASYASRTAKPERTPLVKDILKREPGSVYGTGQIKPVLSLSPGFKTQ